MNNPYSMPQAELTEPVGTETYTPEFFSLDGRIGRLRYWAYSIGWVLVFMVVMMVVGAVSAMTGSIGNAGGTFGSIASTVVSFVVTISLARRRLNDLGKTGWLACLMLVPVVNLIVALWLLFGPGDAESNEYGPAPGPNSTGVKIVGWLSPIIFIGIIAAVAIPAYSAYVAKARAAQLGQ